MAETNAQAQIELHRELAPRYAYRYGFPFSRLFQEDWHAEMIGQAPGDSRAVLDLGCGTWHSSHGPNRCSRGWPRAPQMG